MDSSTQSPALLPTWSPTRTDPWAPGLRCWTLPESTIGPAGLQLWLAAWDPDPPSGLQSRWHALLSRSERRRCATIGTRNGRVRFAASHAAAHVVLPAQRLGGGGTTSLSHSPWLVAIMSAPQPVGIDIEADRPRPNWAMADKQSWPQARSSDWAAFVIRWLTAEARYKAGSGDLSAGGVSVGRVVDLAGIPDHVMAVAWQPRPPPEQ